MDHESIVSVFKELDADNDGFVTLNEMRTGMTALSIPHSRTQLELFFSKMDKDSDGTVSIEEFEEYVENHTKRLNKIFREFDVNGDGKVGRKDLRRVMGRLDIYLSDSELKQLLDSADTNNSGYIEFNEFVEKLLLLPDVHPEGVFQHFLRASAVDTGVDTIEIPDAAEEVQHTATSVLLAAGGVAGAVSRTLTAPMDRLKVILQADTSTKGRASLWTSFKNIYSEGGLRAYFRGNGTNVIKIAPETAVKFLAYERMKQLICKDPEKITIGERFTSGAIAGATAQLTIYPLEITKTRIALGKEGEYKSILDCVLKIVRNEGPACLYRGAIPSVMGIVPYAGVDLTVYSWLKDMYGSLNPDKEPGVGTLLACGAVATTCGQLVAYPLQLVRTRLQAQGMKGRPVEYTGMVDCLQKTVAQDGFFGLYRGILPNFMKAIPAISVSYAVYEKAKGLFSSVRD